MPDTWCGRFSHFIFTATQQGGSSLLNRWRDQDINSLSNHLQTIQQARTRACFKPKPCYLQAHLFPPAPVHCAGVSSCPWGRELLGAWFWMTWSVSATEKSCCQYGGSFTTHSNQDLVSLLCRQRNWGSGRLSQWLRSCACVGVGAGTQTCSSDTVSRLWAPWALPCHPPVLDKTQMTPWKMSLLHFKIHSARQA